MSLLDGLPHDVLTLLFTYLSNESRLALLTAVPGLAARINWSVLYVQKYDPLRRQLRCVHDKYFPITKRQRLDAILRYYSETKRLHKWINNNNDYEADLAIQRIPIVNGEHWRVQDYEYSITDYIYDDIVELKQDNLNK